MKEIRKTLRRAARGAIRRARSFIRTVETSNGVNGHDFSQDDFAYPWLNSLFETILKDPRIERKPSYAWGVVQAAHLAANLKIGAVSVIEFGVAGGNGLVALECAAQKAEELFGLRIDVYGFDTGKGLPKPRDHRDLPNLYLENAFAMDLEKLRGRLQKAQLHIGLIEDTVPQFVADSPAPIAFVSIDVDYYSSTMAALVILDAECRSLLPRVHFYFDDIMGFTNSEFNGERLAIEEFNRGHARRKLSPIYGLQYFVPPRHAGSEWVGEMYLAHIFDHELYGAYDGLVRRPFGGGTVLREPSPRGLGTPSGVDHQRSSHDH